jgi:hypothetical protein
MLLLLLLLDGKKANISFEIVLESNDNQKDFDYVELIEFLDQINYLHKRVIRLTQKEYAGSEFDDAEILDYHRLRIEKVEQNSPLKLFLSFTLDSDNVVPYIAYLKLLFKLCRLYGPNTDDLMDSINSAKSFILKAMTNYKLDTSGLKKILENNVFIRNLLKLMDDETFRKSYNSFCKTGIRFSKFLAITEILGNKIEDNLLE